MIKCVIIDWLFCLFFCSESRRKTQAAKLKCILCYFSQVAGRDLQGTITLQRQVRDVQYSWKYSQQFWQFGNAPLVSFPDLIWRIYCFQYNLSPSCDTESNPH